MSKVTVKDVYADTVIKGLIVIFSSFLFSVAVKIFINPAELLTGGASGISLIISRLLIKFSNGNLREEDFFSVLYILINIPLIIFAYFKIGKRFAIFSALNVIMSSIFVVIIPNDIRNFFQVNEHIAMAIFAGILAGASTGLVLKAEGSGGGADVIAIYLAFKKQISVGWILILINASVVVTGGVIFSNWTAMLYTLVYIYTNGRVVDTINLRTKKRMLHIITTKGDLISKAIMNQMGHGCTTWNAVGSYSGIEKQSLFMVLPAFKADRAAAIAKEIDDKVFITSTEANKIYGNFIIDKLK